MTTYNNNLSIRNNRNSNNYDFGDWLKDYNQFHAYCVGRYIGRYNAREDGFLRTIGVSDSAFRKMFWADWDSAQEFADNCAKILFAQYVESQLRNYRRGCLPLKKRFQWLRFFMYAAIDYLTEDDRLWLVRETWAACEEDIASRK